MPEGLELVIQYIAWKYSQLKDKGTDSFDIQSYQPSIEESNAYLGSERYKADLTYWKEQFEDLPSPLIEKKYKRKQGEHRQSETLIFDISEDKRAYYEAFVQDIRLQPKSFVLIGLIHLLWPHSR